MKVTTFLLLFYLCAAGALVAQTPVANRDQIHQDQTTWDAQKLQIQDLEEKRLRLTEAISDGDLESVDIMKEEILALMDQQIGEGNSWVAKNEPLPALDRLKAIREELAQFPADATGAEKASDAGNLVTEFMALMERAPF